MDNRNLKVNFKINGSSGISSKSVRVINLWITFADLRWLCVFSTNINYLQIEFITLNFNYQIYHNYCQFLLGIVIFNSCPCQFGVSLLSENQTFQSIQTL